MTRWEYHLEADLSKERLGFLGTQGWELVCAVPTGIHPIKSSKQTWVFKRPVAA